MTHDEFIPHTLEYILGQYLSKVLSPSALSEFRSNDDHGFPHSEKVYLRALEIIKQCPDCQLLLKHSKSTTSLILAFAALFHDASRFVGADFKNHEAKSAEMVHVLNNYVDEVAECICHHDWMRSLSNGSGMPSSLNLFLPQVFRLADKTPDPPIKEIGRYY